MNLKLFETLIPVAAATNHGNEKMQAMAWSPNNNMLAVCRPDRVIYLYDENGTLRDKFMSRAKAASANPSGQRDPQATLCDVTALAFSPESVRLAVAQSDGMLYIYKIGEDFKMKKAIINKFQHNNPITSLIWPTDLDLYFCLTDGKVKLATPVGKKANRARTIFNGESYCMGLCSNHFGKDMLSAHVDGKIAVYDISNQEAPTVVSVIKHTCAPSAFCFTVDGLLAAGCDKKIVIYEKSGKIKQRLDVGKEFKGHGFTCCVSNNSGQTVVLASHDHLRIVQYINRRKVWDIKALKKYKNLYSPSCLTWKRDGSMIAVGTSIGCLFLFETIFKKEKNKKFEVTYISQSQVMLKMIERPLVTNIQSKYATEILDVQVMGKDCYAVARTMQSLIICDLYRGLKSEIPWSDNQTKEKFYFENPDVCMIFYLGELILVEYGCDDTIGAFRTELVNPHTISLRFNERMPTVKGYKAESNKKLAYLLDLKTICVVDLEKDITLAQVTHESKIDWLELNETGAKLLYRDRKMRLILVDVETGNKHMLESTCSFVQWVPGSDVIVAQSLKTLKIWYNLDTPEQCHEVEIKGQATDIAQEDHKTRVLIQNGSSISHVPLDEGRVEFVTAIEDGDLVRAVQFLEKCPQNPETEAMWQKLAKASLEARELRIAQTAYASLGDLPRAKFLSDTLEECIKQDKSRDQEPGFWKKSHIVEAKMCLLEGQIKTAEAVYLAHNDVDGAIRMYETMLRFEDAVALANSKMHSRHKELVETFLERLVKTGQYEVGAEFLEKHGDIDHAILLYLEGGYPTKAARLIQKNTVSNMDKEILVQISQALLQGDFLEDAGEFFEVIGQYNHALECYRKGKIFDKAIKLAKQAFPNEVVSLEGEWGDHLASNRQLDAATNHYIEAGDLKKGLDAAIDARQWKKAVEIIKVFEDKSDVKEQYLKLGEYFESVEDFQTAEEFYLKGDMPKRAVDMYGSRDLWEEAHRVASKTAGSKEELQKEYLKQCKLLQEAGKLYDAERLYMAIGEVDSAISMFAKEKMYDDVIRLVSVHHPDHVDKTLKHVADLLSKDDQFRSAEQYYLKAGRYEEAVKMYQRKRLWEDAYRVARGNGGNTSAKFVIFEWAESLGGETALRLLKKFNVVDESIDHYCKSEKFSLAMEMAKIGVPEKVSYVHYKIAKDFERKRNYSEALRHYLEAQRPKDAIEMFVNANMLDEAIDLAQTYAKDEFSKLLLLQAKLQFSQGNYQKFEKSILRAEKPEFGLELYKSNDMWTEAFRLAKEYCPQLMPSLQAEYDTKGPGKIRGENPQTIITQAKEFERIGEYKRAIECYLRLDESKLDNRIALAKCWGRAADLAIKFLSQNDAAHIVTLIAPKLFKCQMHRDAAILYFHIGAAREGIDCFVAGDMWEEAKEAAREAGLEDYVRQRHTEVLKQSGHVDELQSVNFTAALDLLCENGDWERCLEKAKKNEGVLNTYLSRYVTHLLQKREAPKALEAYVKFGVVASKLHYPLYRALAALIFNDIDLDSYEVWSKLRNLFMEVIVKASCSSDGRAKVVSHMEKLLVVSHYYASRSVFRTIPELQAFAAKLSVSLLRYIGIVPCDRAFFEAGLDCKHEGWDNMAFVFLNHYLDIRDAIEQGLDDLNKLDNKDFELTDIPYFNCELPQKNTIPFHRADEIKEWVLTASMNTQIRQELRLDSRRCFEGSLSVITISTYNPGELIRSPPQNACIVTGYPVLQTKVTFPTTNQQANKEDWNKFVMTVKSSGNKSMEDIVSFINNWCGSLPNYSF